MPAPCPGLRLQPHVLSPSPAVSAYWRCVAMFEDFPQVRVVQGRACRQGAGRALEHVQSREGKGLVASPCVGVVLHYGCRARTHALGSMSFDGLPASRTPTGVLRRAARLRGVCGGGAAGGAGGTRGRGGAVAVVQRAGGAGGAGGARAAAVVGRRRLLGRGVSPEPGAGGRGGAGGDPGGARLQLAGAAGGCPLPSFRQKSTTFRCLVRVWNLLHLYRPCGHEPLTVAKRLPHLSPPQEYAHARGPRVSSLLGLPPTSPERARLRSAPFLPTPPVTATMITAPAAAPSAPTAEGEAAPATPTPTLAAATTEEAPTGAPAPAPAPATDTLLLDRPAGGASQLGSLPLTTQDEAAQLAEVGTSSPLSKAPAAALTAASAPTSPDASDSSSTTSNSVMPVASPVATPAPVPSYSVAATPRAVWQQLLAAASLDDLLGPGPSADAAVTTSASGSAARWQYCAVETPSGVWQALLPSASTAAASPSPVPFDAAATPQRVWAALLSRSSAATPPAFPPPSPSPKPSPAAASAAAEADNGLLPRPTPRRRDRDPQRSRTPSPPSSNSSNTSPTAAAPSDAPTAGPTAGAANPSPPASPEKPTGRRGGAKGGGKGSKGHRHAKGGGRKEQRSGGARAGVRAVAQLAAKGASATMSTVTASLGAAAAIGTVLGGASGGHMVDPHTALAVGHGAAAALGHVGGVAPSVAAFWEDLNTLTMASASLSSMDV